MKEKKLLYSIVVPIYNVEEFLKECIESLINQIYTNIEIILVDDGSPDGSPKMCDDYAKLDKRIRVVHKKNGGLVSARKAGAEVATGDYLICVDGDDYVTTDMVEKFNNIISEYKCDVACCSYFVGDVNNPYNIPYASGYYNKNDLVEKIYPSLIEDADCNSFPNSLWAKVYKKDLYLQEQLSLDNTIKIGEDLACTKPIIAKADSMYLLNEPLYFYRINFNSMTKNRKPFNWSVPKAIYNHLFERLKDIEFDFSDQMNRNCVHNVFNVAVSQFYQKDKTTKEIKKEIQQNISSCDIYSSSLEKAFYKKCFIGKLMLFALRRKKYCLLKIYSKVKK